MVSVKGGELKINDIRALKDVARREEKTSLGFGVVVTLKAPTKGMRADAAGGVVTIDGKDYQLVQILTIKDILDGKRPSLPYYESKVYKKAPILKVGIQEPLFE